MALKLKSNKTKTIEKSTVVPSEIALPIGTESLADALVTLISECPEFTATAFAQALNKIRKQKSTQSQEV